MRFIDPMGLAASNNDQIIDDFQWLKWEKRFLSGMVVSHIEWWLDGWSIRFVCPLIESHMSH